MGIQQLIDEIVAKLRALHAALGEQRSKVGAAITALTGEVISDLSPEEAQRMAALTGDLKISADDLESSVAESQK